MLTSQIHFYFTRSDVRSGQLDCATNNANPPQIPRVTYECLNPNANPAAFLEGLKAGVFASMDLPPLFPYVARANRLFEDGGVIDNLPITFPAIEACDLIFILPLNSDFEETPNKKSVLARLLRVMDIRQGVLERSGFKMLYLYNELAALRAEVDAAAGSSINRVQNGPLASAMRRQNELINVFAVCPLKALVEETINTRDLWKRKEAGVAFGVMETATAALPLAGSAAGLSIPATRRGSGSPRKQRWRHYMGRAILTASSLSSST